MPLRLLHVSDIHFHSCVDGWDYDTDQRDELLRDVREIVSAEGTIDGILVGGDIAFKAAPDEYRVAREWLDRLRQTCGDLDVGRVWTVPGNHDIDRSSIGKSRVLADFRRAVRDYPPDKVDEVLRQYLSIDPAAAGLMSPLSAYNDFAGEFQCATTCEQPHWYDESLSVDGHTVRLLGLNSVLISDETDTNETEAGRLVLGTWQCTVPREDGSVHIVIAHHPPSWIKDWDLVQPYLRRAHVLLFGHEHAYGTRQLERTGTVEVLAGAVGPERAGAIPTGAYAPTYNVLTLKVDGDSDIKVTVQPRYWNHQHTRFSGHPDGVSEFVISLAQPPTAPPYTPYQTADPTTADTPDLTSEPRDANALAPEGGDASSSGHDMAVEMRRVAGEYLRLPWTDRIDIARKLGVLEDQDLRRPDTELFPTLLGRIRDSGIIPELIEELHNV